MNNSFSYLVWLTDDQMLNCCILYLTFHPDPLPTHTNKWKQTVQQRDTVFSWYNKGYNAVATWPQCWKTAPITNNRNTGRVTANMTIQDIRWRLLMGKFIKGETLFCMWMLVWLRLVASGAEWANMPAWPYKISCLSSSSCSLLHSPLSRTNSPKEEEYSHCWTGAPY